MSDEYKKKCGKRIQELRRKKYKRQVDFADCLGVTNVTISDWECGRTSPSIEQLPQIAVALGCTVPNLFKDRIMIAVNAGKTYRVVNLDDKKVMHIDTMYLDNRRLGKVVAKSYVAGHGRDFWVCEHDNGDLAVYCFTELTE